MARPAPLQMRGVVETLQGSMVRRSGSLLGFALLIPKMPWHRSDPTCNAYAMTKAKPRSGKQV